MGNPARDTKQCARTQAQENAARRLEQLVAKGYADKDLARMAGVGLQMIQSVLRGARNLGPKAADRLARSLDMTYEQFVAPEDGQAAPAPTPGKAGSRGLLNLGREVTDKDRFLKDAVDTRGAIEPDLLTRAFVNEVRSLADMKYLEEEALARRAFGESRGAVERWKEISERRTGLTLAEAARLACALETDLADLLTRVTQAVRRYAKPGEFRGDAAPYHQVHEPPAPYPDQGKPDKR